MFKLQPKKKPVTVAMGPWKKDPKAVTKKITTALHFPMTVRATIEDTNVFSKEVADTKALVAAIAEAADGYGDEGQEDLCRASELRFHEGELSPPSRI